MKDSTQHMLKKMRDYLFVGLVVSLPAVATIYVLKLLFHIVDPILGLFVNFLIGLIPGVEFPLHLKGFTIEYIPGIGLLLTVILLILLGMATKSFFGKRMLQITEKVFSSIPIARQVYSTVNQVVNAFVREKASFQRVALVEYPRKGVYTVGFLTGETSDEIVDKTGQKMVNIFLPTTPNPTSGWLVLVPVEDVIYLDMKVEDGLKYIVSGGVVVPSWNKNGQVILNDGLPARTQGEPEKKGMWKRKS